MSGGLKSAEEATSKALSFLKKYHPWARPMKAVREDGIWLVQVDVGALKTKIGTIKLDAQTGKVLEFDVPEA
ncbi:MAG: hypothetical protein HYX92_13190 [Chloroflexi bacterium]|nr:hypothetical protein [Chloroflexota bacterium]